jgi:hypothetical protein
MFFKICIIKSRKPLLWAPQQTKHLSQKTTCATKNMPTRTGINITADPKLNQTRPDKKPKSTDITPDPTQNLTEPPTVQRNPTTIDTHIEKKRRREEETADKSEQLKESEHFLTVGPGSQACRDQ